MENIDDNTTDTELTLETILRSSIGQTLTDQEWYAVAYAIETAVENAVDVAVNEALDNMNETIYDYVVALDEESEMEEF